MFDHINDRIQEFGERYPSWLKHSIEIHRTNAISSFESLLSSIEGQPYKLYLLIDEYDNFANEIAMGGARSDAKGPLYNPTLSIYFLDAWQREGEPPEKMLDVNLAMDKNKLEYIASRLGGQMCFLWVGSTNAHCDNNEKNFLISPIPARVIASGKEKGCLHLLSQQATFFDHAHCKFFLSTPRRQPEKTTRPCADPKRTIGRSRHRQ